MVLTGLLTAGCSQKKQAEDIIVPKVEVQKPQGPIRMQEYKQTKDINWLGRPYQVEVLRAPDDSLRMVKDEYGQKFVDNRITLRILRSDGSTFFKRSFTKQAFENYLDDVFAASVCHPQTDEYIPLVVTVSSQGDVGIRRDTEMDTYGNEEELQN